MESGRRTKGKRKRGPCLWPFNGSTVCQCFQCLPLPLCPSAPQPFLLLSLLFIPRTLLCFNSNFLVYFQDDLPGQALLDVVFARLNLIETSYFGIRYIDEENQTHWLDPASRISRQLKPKSDPYDLYFGVKFYAADPCKLLEEITRYQLFLQVKQDVLQGRLPVAFELAAELGAFVVQSELGDYDQRRHSKGYVSEFRLLPNQSNELETRVSELHQQLKGMSPSSAELNYLDKVKWHDMYGVDLHPVLGEDSVEYFLGLTPSGIVVLRNKTTVAHYYWPRIAKVYYKGRYFMLRISDKNNELSTYGFETPRKSACKHLWRCCVEHHAFFRQVRVAPLPSSQSHAADLFQLGSRFRHSRPDKQTEKDALSAGRSPPAFTRTPSKRQPRRVIDDFFNSNGNGNGNGNGHGHGASGAGTLGGGSHMGNRPLPQPGMGTISKLYYQSTHPHEANGGPGAGGHAPKNGSIRSASTISSRECERNNGLVRMMSSMSMGDFISPTGSNLSPLENSALRVSHEHTDSGLGADQDYAYSSERSSDSTRYGTNKSSGASSGSHRKSGGSAGGNYNNLMQQTVSNQQQQQRSLFAQQQRQQKSTYKYATSSPSSTNPGSSSGLAPVHNAGPSSNPSSSQNPNSATNSNQQSPANRLLHYTTFENNQYKFSLNNALAKSSKGVVSGGGSISNLAGNMVTSGGVGGPGSQGGGGAFSRQRSFVEWPSNPASPYYYQGPSTHVAQVKRRDAKSDIGVPTRRLSGQSLTKTQLLTGGGNSQLANAGCYPLHYASSNVSGGGYNRPSGQRSGGNGSSSGGFGLQPAKSDLFLSYIHGGEYERPYIYNYKMPQMPGGAGAAAGAGAGTGAVGSPKQQTTAYHISGSQTADPPPPPPPLYGGTAPANDVMYYQFDKGAAVAAGPPSTSSSSPPIVQQPRQTGGPLVYLQHGQNPSVPEVQQSTVSTKCKPVACRC
ncbi:GD21572 [Drosophila simulans]|uniref:Erythrocyte membrane protein band 4.1-like 4A n=1 Tax=Drosophila simulans TaxID=7240 RepID=B4QSL8_DROSI|nr:GD21572 [Drosophila simulans]